MRWKSSYRIYFWCCAMSLGALQLALLPFVTTGPENNSRVHRQTLDSIQHQREKRINLQQSNQQQDGPSKVSLGNERRADSIKQNEQQQVHQQPTVMTSTLTTGKTGKIQTTAKEKAIDLLGNRNNNNTITNVRQTNARRQLEPILKAGKLYSIGRKDRSGSVVTDMLYAHAFAFAHNVTYAGACYTKRGFPRRDVSDLLERLGWNQFLPFACPDGVGEHLDVLKPKAKDLSPLVIDEPLYRSSKHIYFDEAWRERIKTLLGKQNTQSSKKAFEIAVHVRRGDVTPCRYQRRYLPNDHYLTLIDHFTPHGNNNNRSVHVTVYSESQSFESLDIFRQRGYDVELDTDDLAQVWHALSSADVVILSRSFFSFVPAALNPNMVVYTQFFDFEPLAGWIVVDEALTKETDKEIRKMFREQCDAAEMEKVRQLEAERHRGL